MRYSKLTYIYNFCLWLDLKYAPIVEKREFLNSSQRSVFRVKVLIFKTKVSLLNPQRSKNFRLPDSTIGGEIGSKKICAPQIWGPLTRFWGQNSKIPLYHLRRSKGEACRAEPTFGLCFSAKAAKDANGEARRAEPGPRRLLGYCSFVE